MADLIGALLIGCGLALLVLSVYEDFRIRKARKELEDLIEKEKRNG